MNFLEVKFYENYLTSDFHTNTQLIDLITVLEAILTGRQTRLEIQCLNENRCQLIFIKLRFQKIHELETLDTRQGI